MFKVKVKVKSCLTLCNPVDCSPPGSSIHGIFQARVLEWVAIAFSRGSSWLRDWTLSDWTELNWWVWNNDLKWLLKKILSKTTTLKQRSEGLLLFSHSVTLTLCDPMDCSMPGLPVLHHLLEPAQTHVHQVSVANQPSHPLYPLLFLSSIFPTSGSFLLSWLFASGAQSTGVSASASVSPPMNIHDWLPLGLTGSISLQLRIFTNITVQNCQFFSSQAFSKVQISHPYMTNEKTIALTIQTFN